uniref:enolase C-terminal domain-like protein n=1 Tax=Oceanobacillus massiliensis TaxID=1465765 RepID=UPI00301B3212
MSYTRTSVCLCGGISGTKKIAAIAEAHGVPIVPHNPLSPVSTAACIQIATAVDNLAIQELPDHNTISATERFTSTDAIEEVKFKQRDMVTWVPSVTDGFIEVPVQAGIGIDLVEDAEEKFPYKRREVNTRLHVDGSIVDQ